MYLYITVVTGRLRRYLRATIATGYPYLRWLVSSFAQPGLRSLLLCSDDEVVRALRRVLADLEIEVEHCTDSDGAIRKLTYQSFEAVIVDCTNPDVAAKVLKTAHSASDNKRSITVAMIDGQSALKSAFKLGSHFVVFKPISLHRTRASFRSVRALMKRERRRHSRILVELPVKLQTANPSRTFEVLSADVSENGIAIKGNSKLPPSFQVCLVCREAATKLIAAGNWHGTIANCKVFASAIFPKIRACGSNPGFSGICQQAMRTIRQLIVG